MSIQIMRYTECPDWWDKEVAKHQGLFVSSSAWGDFYNQSYGAKPSYIEVSVDKTRVMLLLVVEMPLGAFLMPESVSRVVGTFKPLRSLTFHLQPVVTDKQFVKNVALERRVSVKVLRYIFSLADEHASSIIPADYVLFRSLNDAKQLQRSVGKDASLIGTTRVMLSDDEDAMYKGMDESVKSGIRKSEKLGITIRELKDDRVELFYEGLKSGWGVHHLAVNPKKFFLDLAKLYPDNIKFFLAFHKKKVVAGSGVMLFGSTMLEFSMFVTPYGREQKIPGGDLVKWHIIRYGIQHKYKILDLNMISIEDDVALEEKIKRINFYKLKWGGDITYGITIHRLSPLLSVIRKVKHKTLGH